MNIVEMITTIGNLLLMLISLFLTIKVNNDKKEILAIKDEIANNSGKIQKMTKANIGGDDNSTQKQ